MTDLSLVSMDDLITELEHRVDHSIVAYVRNLDDKMESAQVSYHGGKFTAIGLAVHMAFKILMDINRQEV